MTHIFKEVGRTLVRASHSFSKVDLTKIQTLVFLGPPGVGKGTYSSRIAKHYGMTHVCMGDLIRESFNDVSGPGAEAKAAVARGELLSSKLVTKMLISHLHKTMPSSDSRGLLLDGFPRTADQAQDLVETVDVKLALNLSLREDVLLAKCLGRRICSKCGTNYNVAKIDFPAKGDLPEVYMPPLDPKEGCRDSLVTRKDDTEEVFKRRMEVYHAEAKPVEDVFRQKNLLIEFPIKGGIPETLPRLIELLEPYNFAEQRFTSTQSQPSRVFV